MSRKMTKFYGPRQVIKMDLVKEGDYTEKILLCLPKFAWDVARAYLSEQALWPTSYAMEYTKNYYLSPDSAEMDVIKSSIAEALSEADMSCDLAEAIEAFKDELITEMGENNGYLVDVINALVDKDCCAGAVGSGGAGAVAETPIDWDDTGENYPDEFDSREEYNAWKCGAAKLIFDQINIDLHWLQNTDLTGIIAATLIATLLTPVPGDEIVVMVGGIAVMILEGILDTALDVLIEDYEDAEQEILCMLYQAINSNGAVSAVENWADEALDWAEGTILNWFISTDIMNWLFSKPSLLLPDADCSECVEICENEEIWSGSGTIGEDTVTLDSAIASGGYHTAAVSFDCDEGTLDICGDGVMIDSWVINSGAPTHIYWLDMDGVQQDLGSSIPSLPFGPTYLVVASDHDAPIAALNMTVGWSRD